MNNPERVRQPLNPFRVRTQFIFVIPGLSLRSNRWAEISERLRRYCRGLFLLRDLQRQFFGFFYEFAAWGHLNVGLD